ncbi:MAG: hypothetical protein CMN29_12045 [Sandaracinus sp.]|nr:hypothetical protein [Sandaracinus sp.]
MLLLAAAPACGDDDAPPSDGGAADARPADGRVPDAASSSASLAITAPAAGAAVPGDRADVTVAFDAGDADAAGLTLELRARGLPPTTVALDRARGEQLFPGFVLDDAGRTPEVEVPLGARLLRGDELLASTARTVVVSRAAEARARLAEAAPGSRVAADPDGRPRRVEADLPLEGATPEARARRFLERYGALFDVADPEEARLARSRPLAVGDDRWDQVVFRQVHAGLEVIGARAALTLDGERLVRGTLRWASGLGELPRDLVGPTEAVAILARARDVSDPAPAGRPRLGWWDDRVSLPLEARPEPLRPPEPVWQIRLPVEPAGGPAFTLHAFVGATSGEVLESWSTSRGDAPARTTHDLEGMRHADCQSSSLLAFAPLIECLDGGCLATADGYTRRTHQLAGRAGVELDALGSGLASLFGYGAPSRLQLFARDRDPGEGEDGPAGSYDAQCDFVRIGGDESSPRLLGHEVAHAFIEESAGLAGEGASGAVAEGLAYFFGSHLAGQTGGERCELTCDGVDGRGLRLTLADYVPLLPGETHANGRLVQLPLELLATGGRYPELRTEPLTPDGTYAGIGPAASARLAGLALALASERDGVVDFFDHLLVAAALLEEAGELDAGQECNAVLVVAESAFTSERGAQALFGDPGRFAQLAACLGADPDGDLVPSDEDLCPLLTGDDQEADLDGDGIGDECDLDRDGDGTANESDLCPDVATAHRLRLDLDGDGLGAPCDEDDDGDGVPDEDDVCPTFPGEDPADCADDDGDGVINGRDRCPDRPFEPGDDLSDADGDGLGAACDEDDDGDGVPDEEDLCPRAEGGAEDADGDGVGDACDFCPAVADADGQVDSDWDGEGDACDADDDDDGVPDADDNCPTVANAKQRDLDANGRGVLCDTPELRRILLDGEVAVLAEADVAVALPLCQEDCALEAATEGGWSITLALPAEAEVAPAVVGSFGEVIAWLAPQDGGGEGGDVVYTGELVVGEVDLALGGEALGWASPTYSLVLDPAGSPELSLPGPMIVQLVTPTSEAPTCGDGEAGAGEVCDGGDLRGLRCTTLGFDSGALACDGSCAFDTSGCGRCGDGRRSSDEVCDGSDFGGDSCEARGYVGGSLSCEAGCGAISDAGCTPCASQDACRDLGADACLATGLCGSCARDADCPASRPNCTFGACLPPF